MKIRIGTRKSKLAVAQTEMVVREIAKLFPEIDTEIVYISTTGDKVLDKPLLSIGGKGVFVSEIENALQKGLIDIAVHSAKDLPTALGEGLEISGVLKRGNYRDVLVTNKRAEIKNSPDFTVGTGSLRRRMNLSRIYPNVKYSDIRGNVDTRLNKLANGEYDAVILAMAGLERLALDNDPRFEFTPFNYDEFLPAPCQGIVAVESRVNDFVTPVINKISCKNTFLSFETERYIIEKLNAGCGIPLGAYSFAENEIISVSISESGDRVLSGTESIENRFKLVKELISCL